MNHESLFLPPPQLAAKLAEDMSDAHRGVINRSDGALIVFGNDGYSSGERAKREVEEVRRRLPALGLDEKGFGVDPDDGYTWVLIVASQAATQVGAAFCTIMAAGEIEDALWAAWTAASADRGLPLPGFEEYQRMVATETIKAACA